MNNPSKTAQWPRPNLRLPKNPALEARIENMLAQMSLEEKIGQMIQPEIRHVTPDDIKTFHIGSVLNGGGSVPNGNRYARASDWLAMADGFYEASMDASDGCLPIPIMWGTDAVHGVGNVVGATLFPHNIGLGAMHNPALIKKIGAVTAREIAVLGLDWDFSPTVAVARDDRWGRTYESWSEDPALVKEYAAAMVEGLQGLPEAHDFLNHEQVIATAKHFIGDGGTINGIDRGDNQDAEATLRDIHGAGYFSAIEAGVQAVMASFNAWHGERLHGHHYLLTTVLKDQLGFDGVVVGDWNGHKFIKGASALDCPQAINAGLDIFMIPDSDWKVLYKNTLAQANNGTISRARIDDAVRRILRVKLRAGLFEKGKPSSRPLAGNDKLLGTIDHRAVARQAVRESLVLLKNKNNLLPLSPALHVLVAGDGADNISKQTGGWSITWQGTGNSLNDFPGATTLLQGITDAVVEGGGKITYSPDGSFNDNLSDRPDVAVVIFGEDPYAEMQGDLQNLMYKPGAQRELALLKDLKQKGIPVVSLFITGRPLWVNPELNASDAFMVVWLPGTEGAGVADVLFKTAHNAIAHSVQGRLTFSWPKRPDQGPLNIGDDNYDPLFAYGYGLRYGEIDFLSDELSEQGMSLAATKERVDLFHRRPVSPWHIVIEGGENDRLIVRDSFAQVSTLSVQTVDREVQEDARHIIWNGKGKGMIALETQHRQVLIDYLEADGVVAFELCVDTAPTAEVLLRIGCGPSSYSDLPITDVFTRIADSGWRKVLVPLSLFPKVKSDFGLVLSPNEFFNLVLEPFTLVTEGALSLKFSNVWLQKGLGANGQIIVE